MREQNPIVKWENGQGNISDVCDLLIRLVILLICLLLQQLKAAGRACAQSAGGPPNLMVVRSYTLICGIIPMTTMIQIILPEGGNDIYTAVKQCVPRSYVVA